VLTLSVLRTIPFVMTIFSSLYILKKPRILCKKHSLLYSAKFHGKSGWKNKLFRALFFGKIQRISAVLLSSAQLFCLVSLMESTRKLPVQTLECTRTSLLKVTCCWSLCSVLGTPFYVMEYARGRLFKDPSLPGMTVEERKVRVERRGGGVHSRN